MYLSRKRSLRKYPTNIQLIYYLEEKLIRNERWGRFKSFKKIIYLFLERGESREKNIEV